MSEQTNQKASELRQRYWEEIGKPTGEDSDKPAYIPWIEALVAKLEEENEALKNFLRQVKAMMRERYQPHVIERQIDALLTDLKEVAQSTKEISAIPEDTQVSDS